MFKKATDYLLFGFTVLLLGGLLWVWFSPSGLTNAPDISFPTLDGREISLAELRGRPVIITFWATTCPGCRKEMPHLIELYNELSPKGLEIIGVAMPYDPPNQVLEVYNREKIPYPIALDIDGKATRAFGDIMLTPTSFVIDPDGKIVRHKIGEMDIPGVKRQITELLSQSQLTTGHSHAVNAVTNS